MKITVLNKQSVFDLAVRYCGTAQSAFALAVLNGISVTTPLDPGSELQVPEAVEKDIVAYFNSRNHQPATAWSADNSVLPPKMEGISYWGINVDFIATEA